MAKRKKLESAKKPAGPKKFSRTFGMLSTAFEEIPLIAPVDSSNFIKKKTIPTTAVDFVKFAKKYDLSPTVLIQIKRHDQHKELGRVFIRKNQDTRKMEIWRDPYQESIY